MRARRGEERAPGGTDASDDRLVALALEDRGTFGDLYDRYLEPVFRYSYRRLGDREAAEDATASVFVRALDRLPSYRGGSFRAWLFTIAHNVTVDEQRRRARWVGSIDDGVGGVEPRSPDPGPEEGVVAAESAATLRDAVGRLTADQRHVVDLLLAGLSGPEIGAVLGKPPDAIRATKARAVARLRQILHEGDDHG